MKIKLSVRAAHEQEDNPKGRKNYQYRKCEDRLAVKKAFKTFVLIFAVLMPAALIALYCIGAKSEYDEFMLNANENKEAGQYIEAALAYERGAVAAKKIPFNLNAYTEALCKEGNCYLVAALKKDLNGDGDTEALYAKAAGIYGNIINDKNLENCDYYVDALCGLSTVYQYTGHLCDDMWADLTKRIDERAVKLEMYTMSSDELSNIDDELLKRYIKIASAYDGYIYAAIMQEQAVTATPILMQSAINSWRQLNEFMEAAAERDLELSIIIDPTYNVIRQAELLLLCASMHAMDSTEFAQEAISVCQSELNEPRIRTTDINNYVTLNRFIGEGYRYLGEFYEDDGDLADEYMTKSHDTLMPLLSLRGGSVTLDHIVTVAYQAIFTGKCTQKELKKILQLYQGFYKEIDIISAPQNAASKLMNICDACRGIITIYGSSQDAWDLGKASLGQISTIESYVQYSHRPGLQEFKEYFGESN